MANTLHPRDNPGLFAARSFAHPKPSFYALKAAHFIILRVNVDSFSAAQTKAAIQTLAPQAVAKL